MPSHEFQGVVPVHFVCLLITQLQQMSLTQDKKREILKMYFVPSLDKDRKADTKKFPLSYFYTVYCMWSFS